MSHSSHSHRPLALATALALAGACVVPAAAAEPIGDGVAPTYDEAYYATLDYYGNLTEGSVVKQLILFALPFLASNLVQSFYSVADMLIVGNFSGNISSSCKTS